MQTLSTCASFRPKRKKLAIAVAASALAIGSQSYAQGPIEEEVVVTGIRASLTRALDVKRESTTVSDAIASEDLGKFPDLNVAESLQRVTGVSIDRDGGEGQQVTVRGFGPQFNMVLVNGRQIASDAQGREFNFDVIAADQITGADIHKSTQAYFQEGGIGATINIKTARPFDFDGLQIAGSLKGVYETLSEEMSPAVTGLFSTTFADDRAGVLVALSHQQRTVQRNGVGTAGWRPGLTLQNNAGDSDPDTVDILAPEYAGNVYLPRNWDAIVDEQDRTRTNASVVFQFAPNDDITVTVDGFSSVFEVDSEVTDLAAWFEPDRVGSASVDSNGTALAFDQIIGLDVSSGSPRTDFVSNTRNARDVNIQGFGANVEWLATETLTANFDLSMSSAENDMAGKNRFNVIGIENNYSFDGLNNDIPIVTHDDFIEAEADFADARAHYNEVSGFTDEDDIIEFKADFVYEPEMDVFQELKFGLYSQSREKSRFQKFDNVGCLYCGYAVPVPNGLLFEYEAANFFEGMQDVFYSYNADEYFAWMGSDGLALIDAGLGLPSGSAAAFYGDGFVGVLQDNRYTINEDISAIYLDATFMYDLGDMPLAVNMGARYSRTDIEVSAIQADPTDIATTSDQTLFQTIFGPARSITGSDSYGNLLPSINIRLDLTDDMVLRYSIYETLTRPTLAQLSPATIYNEPRRQNLTASGGNPELRPFTSKNWDLSFEWYYGDASSVSIAFFGKEVDDFIVTNNLPEEVFLSDRVDQPNFGCSPDNDSGCADSAVVDVTDELNGLSEIYTVTRPQNTEQTDVTGFEFAVTHVWDMGIGVTANATIVDSNATFDPNNTDQSFALEGLGDSQNLIVFYEAGPFQARLAFNNREAFLRELFNEFNGEPVNTRTYGQWDMSASYEITDMFTVFLEGINITEEELIQTGRFDNQIYNVEDNGARYSLGIRAKY